ncbi:MAG TPA: hypothetical protein VIP29_07595 [Nitrososphaeraceae archaeon]|nr:hypothetical protein [Nitrososphaeraceae archaeon]
MLQIIQDESDKVGYIRVGNTAITTAGKMQSKKKISTEYWLRVLNTLLSLISTVSSVSTVSNIPPNQKLSARIIKSK